MLKAVSLHKIFKFLTWFFGHVRKRLDKETKANIKIYGVTTCETNNCSTHIAQYLKK